MSKLLQRRVVETVLCFVRDEQNRFLFLVRGRKPGDVHAGKYNAPGGKLEQGESPKAAMQREVLEETGLRVIASKKLGFLAFPGFHGGGVNTVDESVHVYLITEWEGEPLKECAEGELVWVPAGEVLSLPLWEGDKLFFPYVLEGRRFDGALYYQDGKLIRAEIEGEPA